MRSLRALLPLSLLALQPLSAVAQDLSAREKEIAAIEAELPVLGSRYLRAPEPSSPEAIQEQAQQGQLYYFLKDYVRASTILWDLVEDPANKTHPSYPEAIFHLADSLYHNGNWLAARFYFEQIRVNPLSKYREQALLRLLEMSEEAQDPSIRDALIADAKDLPKVGSALGYALGKALFAKKNYADALAYFSLVPSSDPNKLPALYFQGTTRVAEAKRLIDDAVAKNQEGTPEAATKLLEEAKELFRKAVTTKPTESQQEIRWLSHLALARIHYEFGKYDDASKEYLDIPTSSESYAVARYELAWVYIAQKELSKAYTTLNTIRLYISEGPILADVLLLQGSIYNELGRFSEAMSSYESLLTSFAPIQKQLQETLSAAAVPTEYFRSMIVEGKATDARDLLPSLARPWVESTPLLERVLKLQDELRLIEANMRECDQIIDLIEGKLSGRSRIESFPALAAGKLKALTLYDQLLLLRKDALSVMGKELLPSAIEEERKKLESLFAELATVDLYLQTIPKGKERFDERTLEIKERFSSLLSRNRKLALGLDGLSARQTALEKFYRDSKSAGTLSKEELASLETKIFASRKEIQTTQGMLDALSAEIERERALVGVNDEAFVREEELRALSRSLQGQVEEIYEAIAKRSGVGKQQARAELLLDRVAKAETVLDGFVVTLDDEVEKRLGALKEQVSVEKRKLVRYREEHVAVSSEGLLVAGNVIYGVMQKTSREFAETILQANVGIIDVAWAMKEKIGQEFSEVKERKQSDLDALQDTFDEALKEQ
jgi:tetratricopeptide (TPR) repeat protein